MWRETSTTSPSVSDWPLVPVPPPRGANISPAKRGSPASTRDADEVVRAAREGDRLRHELVDRVVGRQHRPVGVGRGEIALEAARAQLGQELDVERRGMGCRPGAGS